MIDPRTDRDALQMFHRLLSELSRAKGFPARRFQIHYAIWRHFYFACMNRLRRLARRLMEERYDWTRCLAPLASL